MTVSHNTRQLKTAARLLIDADVKAKVTDKVSGFDMTSADPLPSPVDIWRSAKETSGWIRHS
jgi:hypothetical protein